jgi:Ni/Co efflux regulator RcnB
MQTSRLRSILFAAVAAASFGTCVAQAQPYQPGPPPPGWHHWHRGDRYYGPRRVVTHWNHYHLPPPPYGSVWVQEGPQFVLLDGRGFVTRVWVP